MDFILEMAAIDEPKLYEFHRAGQSKANKAQINAAWHKVLAGSALKKSSLGKALELANALRDKWQGKQRGGLRPGMSRGGKPLKKG